MERNRSIDVLKGILAIFVITLHFGFQGNFATYGFPFSVQFAVPGFMFVSGYLAALSFQRNGTVSLEEAYSAKVLTRKLLRLAVPYTWFFICYQILFRMLGTYSVGIRQYGLLALFFDYLTGGVGQGSYYFPVMIQFLFLFPLLYFMMKKAGTKGLIWAFLGNLLYEILKQAYGMSAEEYRLLVFRYLFIIACGIFAALQEGNEIDLQYNNRLGKLLVGGTMLLAGIFFIWLFTFTAYQPKIITMWTTTSVLTGLYIVPLLLLYVKTVHIKCYPLELVGKASFHVFLTQMLWYSVYAGGFLLEHGSKMRDYCIGLAVCLVVGILFYFAETRLTTFLLRSGGKKLTFFIL